SVKCRISELVMTILLLIVAADLGDQVVQASAVGIEVDGRRCLRRRGLHPSNCCVDLRVHGLEPVAPAVELDPGLGTLVQQTDAYFDEAPSQEVLTHLEEV